VRIENILYVRYGTCSATWRVENRAMNESSRLSDCSRFFCAWAATVEPMADVNWTVVLSFIHRCELCDLDVDGTVVDDEG
jgi:hypothetical protein